MVCIVTQVAQITHLVQDNTLCCIAYTEGVKLFCGKFYTGQKKFTQAPPVVPVTNMRYVSALCGHCNTNQYHRQNTR